VTFRGARNAQTRESQLPKAPPSSLQASLLVYKRNWGIYRLTLGFQHFQVSLSAFDRTRYVRTHSCKNFCIRWAFLRLNIKTCVRAHILQNWAKLVKCDFVDLRDIFLKTPRSPQSELYNSRYGRFGGSHRVRIITRLNFATKAP
jgi:hypothetical protein